MFYGNLFILFLLSKGVAILNLLMVIFGLVAILGLVGTVQALKEKAFLGVIFNFAAFAVFGWFVVMTILHQGFPPSLH